MILMKIVALLSFWFLFLTCFGQMKPINGVKKTESNCYALKNVTIYVSPDDIMQSATIVIRDGKVESVGKLAIIPKDAIVYDYSNKVILPSFIELNAEIGLPEIKAAPYSPHPQLESLKKGAYYWNETVHPEIDASSIYETDSKANKQLIEMGFGAALTHQHDGISRGTGALVTLNDGNDTQLSGNKKYAHFSFQKGVSKQSYPTSQMGAIALLRQFFYDADWYQNNAEFLNLSLEAFNQQKSGVLFFETKEKWEVLRAEKIAKEFDLHFNYIGSGNEYAIVDQLKDVASTVVVPLNFPAPYDVKNPYVSRQIPLSDLKHWELAPMNPAILSNAGVSICLSSSQCKTPKEFWANLRSAIDHGLSEEDALRALTITPAKLLEQDDNIGDLSSGKLANFVVYDANPLQKEASVLESWIHGVPSIYQTIDNNDISGNYNLILSTKKFPIEISGKSAKYKGKLTYQVPNEQNVLKDSTVNLYVESTHNDITLQFNIDDSTWKGSVTLHGKTNSKFGVFEGEGFLPNGEWIKWSAIKNKKGKNEEEEEKHWEVDTTKNVWFPNMAYGFDSVPEPETIVITNATLWTNEKDGIIENGTVIVQNGKITFAGKGNHRIPNGAKIIDAKGKHVTSGIIDEHSHIAISKGVNESGQAISAEVSIGDVINPDDINIYRQLSGGVTASQLLHGSANPIGGQSALIKLKWGHTADEMLIKDAPKFIKFALGENVKQSNWGNYNQIRFPQTRMGVEQLYLDGFQRALQYKKEWQDYAAKITKIKPRKDLELEVLNEILESKRFISCHSYIQSEINMLMHVADSMGFTVNTFTHILEGYKVADKMVEHGAGGSTFSDWWAYKYEVNDAIPYNASLMNEQGVVVAINSDDAEMGRRLNQEAAKGIKYGGMTEEEAWKMVTLNPAKLLHLEERMGSLKPGKDADIVIWTDNPLSINAKVEYTIVDGEILYSSENDVLLRKRNQAEKARLISKMLADKTEANQKRTFIKQKKGHFHCNTIGEELSTEENHH